MLDRWIADWARTPKAARIAMVILAIASLLLATYGAIYNIRLHDYPNAAAEVLVLAYLLGSYVIWPFRLAWAVRHRGGTFGGWFAAAVVVNFLIVGIFYLGKWSGRPLLVEDAEGHVR